MHYKNISPSEEVSKKENINFIITDISGDEYFIHTSKLMLKVSEGIILVYSKNDRKSFEDIENIWIKLINEYFNIKNIPILLVANKFDLLSEEVAVSHEEEEELSMKYNIPFFECSAKDNYNIDTIFDFLTKKLIEEYQKRRSNDENENKVFTIEKKEIADI